MAGFSFTNPFVSIFDPTGKVAPSYEELQQRKKIAAAMMARPGRMPKTFGEGLQAIGEAWGDRSYYDKTLADEQGAQAYEASQTAAVPPSAPVPITPYTPPPAQPTIAPAAPGAAVAPPPGPQSDAVPPPDAVVPPPGPQAANGFRPPPAYLAAALANSGLPPERQAYLGHLAGKEARSATEVSPTGAAGPFQFVRSTGRQYGLVGPEGDRRTDIDASIAAVNRLTDDNAAVLERALGRPPSPGELALAHQQGAGTAARMLTGAGNAPNYNLAVNNAGGLGPQAAAQKIMAYYGMPGGPAGPGPQDTNAAVLADRGAPLGGADVAQNVMLAEVTGNTAQAERANYAPTASLRTGSVMNDADPESPALQTVGDSVQARRDAITGAVMQQPQPIPPPGPVLAQAPPPPGTATDVRQGPQIPKAPDVPIRAAPPAPKLLPMVDDYIQHQQAIANNPRLSDTARTNALRQIESRQSQIKAVNDQTLTEYNDVRKQWLEQQSPDKIYATEKARRELEGEGAIPLTPEQRKQFAIPESQPAWLTRRGEIKLGPAGQTINVGTDKAQSKGDEKLQEKLSESFIKTFEEGNTAGDDIKQLAEMRALAARVGTGAGAVVKQYLGQWGIKSEGLSEIEALNAGISRLIPQQRVPGSGTSSDFDGNLFKGAVVALNKTPEGNNLIFDTMDGLAKNKLARADVAGRVISGEITRSDGVKEMLGLQREAKDLSDRVKEHLKATGQDKSVAPAVPQQVQDDQARQWLQNNPNHPKADAVRRKLGL